MWKTSIVSKHPLLLTAILLILLLLLSTSVADIHKWVDESGQVHYGGCPPAECNSQIVDIPNPPSQKEVERAHQRFDRYQQIIRQHSSARMAEPIETAADSHQIPSDVPCFDPLYNIVVGPSHELHTPITPSILSKRQRRDLQRIFKKLASNWRKGKVNIITCKETSATGPTESICQDDQVQLEVDGDIPHNRLQIKLQWHDELANRRDRRILSFEIGDRLYYTGNSYFQKITLPGNSVEILHLDGQSLLFLIKPRIRGVSGRIPRPELRYFEVSDKRWRLTELRYIQNRLHEKREWRFAKSRY